MFEAHLHRIFDAVVDGFIVIDKVGSILYFNPSASDIFGYSKEDVIGQNVSMLMPEPFQSEHDSYLDNYHKTGEKKIIGLGREIIAKRKSGETFPMELSVSEVTIDEKKLFLGSIRDISARKLAESELKDSVSYVETLLDTVLDGLITIDVKGNIQAFNKSAESIFGYSADEVKGHNVKMLMPEPYHSEHDGYLQNYRQTKTKKVIGLGREVRARKKDGTIFPIELGVNEMVDSEQVTYVGTIRDISERREAEKAIQSYIAALKLSNQELDQFAYIASHDLKEPLRGLANNAMFLEEDFHDILGESGKRRVSRMRFLCERMEELVNSLLYYSRLGRQELAIERKPIGEIVEKVVEIALPEDDPELELRWSESLPEVLCDVPKTIELFRNLITNAIKYNHSKPKRIEVGVTQGVNPLTEETEERVFYVKDNGIGIEPQFFEDIFRIFKRLNEEDDSIRGTGVGLTFVKKIVERHKGQIWLESSPAQGSCFFFTLKLEEEQ